MPPLSQATASGHLYPWSHSLSLPASQTLGHPVRLPTALQLTLQPFERTFGLTQPAGKWWKPSCPSHSPCWDALFGAEPPRLPSVQSIPPPNTFPRRRPGSRAALGPRAAHPQRAHAGRRGEFCRWEQTRGSQLRAAQVAAAPQGAGATQHLGAAPPVQPSRHNVPVPAEVEHPLGTN